MSIKESKALRFLYKINIRSFVLSEPRMTSEDWKESISEEIELMQQCLEVGWFRLFLEQLSSSGAPASQPKLDKELPYVVSLRQPESDRGICSSA